MTYLAPQSAVVPPQDRGDWRYLPRCSAPRRSFDAMLAATERGELVSVDPDRVRAWAAPLAPRKRQASPTL